MNPWPGIVLCGLVAVVAIVLYAGARRGDDVRKLKSAAGAEAAERLIRHEQAKASGLSRSEAARRAYDRLIADRTR